MCQVSWCCTYLEGFKDVSFTSWWYWGRVSLPPSPAKLLRNTHISTVFPLVQLFVSAEEDINWLHMYCYVRMNFGMLLQGWSYFQFIWYLNPEQMVRISWVIQKPAAASSIGARPGSSSLSSDVETKWSIMSEFSPLPCEVKAGWCGQPITAEWHRQNLWKGWVPLNLPPNTLLLFLLQGQGIIFESESPNFTTGHMRLQLTKYSRFWVLFLYYSDHLVGSSWMLCPSVAESAALLLHWEVTMGFNLAIAVKSLYKCSSPSPSGCSFSVTWKEENTVTKNKRGHKNVSKAYSLF